MNIETKQLGAVTTVKVEESQLETFVTSDVHFDGVFCERKTLFSDLDEAKRRNAKIIVVGDFFDAMNGRFDPRRDMSLLRPEYRRSDYYDYVVKDAADKLEKYAENILMISPGNHESSVLKNANTNLSDRLVYALNQRGGNIIHGGYGGWIRVLFVSGKHHRGSVRIKYYHGTGGEAPVTRGAIQTNRQAVYLPDADIVLNGHSHHSYWIPITRERITDGGLQFYDTQHHVRTPGYNNTYNDGTEGWGIEKGHVPKPMGGCFITMKRENDGKQCAIEINPIIHNPSNSTG